MARRRHLLVGVCVADAPDQLAAGGVAGLDDAHRLVAQVQPQIPFAVLLVGAVAGEAVVREDRAHVAVEVDLRGLLGDQQRGRDLEEREQQQAVTGRASHDVESSS